MLLVIYCKACVLSCTIIDILNVEYWRGLEIGVIDQSRLLKAVPIESFCTLSYSHSVATDRTYL